jgi:hypothetical protein
LSFDFPHKSHDDDDDFTKKKKKKKKTSHHGAIAERDVFFCGFVFFDHETARLFRRRYLLWSFSSRFALSFAKAKLFFPEEEEEDIT